MANKLQDTRIAKLEKIRALGIEPFGNRFEKTTSLAQIRAGYTEPPADSPIRAAGRIILLRSMGKLIFATIRDLSADIQICLRKDDMPDDFALAKLLDLGDIVGVQGKLGKTRTDEITIFVQKLTLLNKSVKKIKNSFHSTFHKKIL